MTSEKIILGTPIKREAEAEMAVPFALHYQPTTRFGEPSVGILITTADPDDDTIIRQRRRDIALETFYELREAVNDLYEHIRQETPTD